MLFNWVDWVIIAVIFYYIVQGWERGLISLTVNLVSFIASLWLSIKYHAVVGNFLFDKFGIPIVWSQVAGYLVVGILSETIIAEIISLFTVRLPQKFLSSTTNKWLGVILSIFNGLTLIIFFLLIILVLPLRGSVKKDIRNSAIGNKLVLLSEKYGGNLKSSLDGVAREAVQFLTIKPKSTERINLDINPTQDQLTTDEASERKMEDLVNSERTKLKIGKLRLDTNLREVARSHSKDMFLNRYFSHVDLAGHDVAYRVQSAGISFTTIGENLAYAADALVAHQGLMNSEGHRRNISDPQFNRIGIGAIDAGTSGEMFTQLFAD